MAPRGGLSRLTTSDDIGGNALFFAEVSGNFLGKVFRLYYVKRDLKVSSKWNIIGSQHFVGNSTELVLFHNMDIKQLQLA